MSVSVRGVRGVRGDNTSGRRSSVGCDEDVHPSSHPELLLLLWRWLLLLWLWLGVDERRLATQCTDVVGQ